jgi:hypothetical protein
MGVISFLCLSVFSFRCGMRESTTAKNGENVSGPFYPRPFLEAWDGAYKALRSMVVDQRAGGARLDVGEAPN